MTTSSTRSASAPGWADRAPATAAGAALVLSVVFAGVALASAVAGGDTPDAPPTTPAVVVTVPVDHSNPTITTDGDTERRGGLASPLHAD